MKIALGQINPTIGDFSGNSKKIIESARQAHSLGAEIAGLGFVVELDFLNGRDKLKEYDVFSLLHYGE